MALSEDGKVITDTQKSAPRRAISRFHWCSKSWVQPSLSKFFRAGGKTLPPPLRPPPNLIKAKNLARNAG